MVAVPDGLVAAAFAVAVGMRAVLVAAHGAHRLAPRGRGQPWDNYLDATALHNCGRGRCASPLAARGATGEARPVAAATIAPLASLTAQVAGAGWDVVTVVPPGHLAARLRARPARREAPREGAPRRHGRRRIRRLGGPARRGLRRARPSSTTRARASGSARRRGRRESATTTERSAAIRTGISRPAARPRRSLPSPRRSPASTRPGRRAIAPAPPGRSGRSERSTPRSPRSSRRCGGARSFRRTTPGRTSWRITAS